MTRPLTITIDKQALVDNYHYAKGLTGEGRVVAVVKANAYGHHSSEVAKILDPFVDCFAVACLDEAMHLRAQHISAPILLIEGVFSAGEYKLASEQNMYCVVHSERQLTWLDQEGLSRPIKIWVKFDTGMHRLGFGPEKAASIVEELSQNKNVSDVVIMSHMANADAFNESNEMQLNSFLQIRQVCSTLQCSLSNSAALLSLPASRLDWNRPGIMLYGISPFTFPSKYDNTLTPVMTLSSEVIAIRDIAVGESVGYGSMWKAQRRSQIATVAVGYGDGYPRSAKNGTPVLINGIRCPLVGRVSMDMITVDVTDLVTVKTGDPVELWGKNLLVNEVAQYADTIGYELTTRLTGRARLYVE